MAFFLLKRSSAGGMQREVSSNNSVGTDTLIEVH